MSNISKEDKRSFIQKISGNIKIPHTLVIISFIVMLVAIATYFVPGGTYERAINDAGRTVVIDGSFHFIENEPQGVFSVLQAPIEGIINGAEIIAFLFVVNGAFNLVTRTKAIDLGIVRIVNIFKGKEILIIPIISIIFSIGGAIFGMSEEAIPFVTILMPLMLALGYDSILAVGISYLACILGFSTAMLNPFTVGIAQSIAEIPMFSGIGYRTIIWAITTIVGVGFMMLYASKIKKNPKKSLVFESDEKKRKNLGNIEDIKEEFTFKHKMILFLVAIGLFIIVWGVLALGFWIPQIAAIFLGMGIFSGIIGGLNADEMADAFIEGAKAMVGASIMLGFARAIVIIAENAHIIDTLLYYLSFIIGKLPLLFAAYVMLPVQMFINFFVSSGSGQAALTMPILAPLGDLIGISRQLTVLIFQLGDGCSNALFPTSGVLVACLGVAGIPYTKWFKWVFPIQLILFLLGLLYITIAIFINWC